jgi:hypothetical protein
MDGGKRRRPILHTEKGSIYGPVTSGRRDVAEETMHRMLELAAGGYWEIPVLHWRGDVEVLDLDAQHYIAYNPDCTSVHKRFQDTLRKCEPLIAQMCSHCEASLGDFLLPKDIKSATLGSLALKTKHMLVGALQIIMAHRHSVVSV